MKYKLAILELIAGLFGWIWIGANIAVLYFLVLAIGFNGTWESFFWALGIGIIAKWLAKGFEENKQRIALENQLSTEATSNSDRHLDVISNYGLFLERNPTIGEIRDVSDLPHSKEKILSAILLQLNTENNLRQREVLKMGAITLVDFQEGVGDKPLSMLGIHQNDLLRTEQSTDELRAMAHKIANNPNRERYKSFRTIADEELSIIQEKLDTAEKSRQR